MSNEPSDSVHEAMQRAIDKAPDQNLKQFTFRASQEYLDVAHQICERHGVTLGSWLRECVTVLVDDYAAPKAQ